VILNHSSHRHDDVIIAHGYCEYIVLIIPIDFR
jgi:hypothetical protein